MFWGWTIFIVALGTLLSHEAMVLAGVLDALHCLVVVSLRFFASLIRYFGLTVVVQLGLGCVTVPCDQIRGSLQRDFFASKKA